MPEQTITQCKSCGASVFYAKTSKGFDCPYDAATVDDDKAKKIYVYMPDLTGAMQRAAHGHRSHFTSCPNAQWHSKKA